VSRKVGYGQFCPVAKAAEIVAERWTPLVLRELIAGSCHFNEIRRGVPLMSPSLLSQRLRELEDAGVVERRRSRGRAHEYVLTPAGNALRPIIESLGMWGDRWARSRIQPRDYDPGLLMWDIRRNIDVALLPADRRTVVEFDVTGVARELRRWWLVVDGGEIDLCLKDPGHEVDIHVTGHIRAFVEVWMGHLPLPGAVRDGALVFEGPRSLVASFRKSLKLSVFANA